MSNRMPLQRSETGEESTERAMTHCIGGLKGAYRFAEWASWGSAKVTLAGAGVGERAEVMHLTAPEGNAAAKTGVTLGGASISSNGP